MSQAPAPPIAGDPTATDFDVVVIGGGFGGASLGILLRRWLPESRVLVVESRGAEERKVGEVGEATVEVSAYFMHRVLGLYDYLNRIMLPKHGLRYWFADQPNRKLTEMSEIGPAEIPHLPAFQLDRALLDEHLLDLAAQEGCQVLRPARIGDVDLAWPASSVEIQEAGASRRVTTRWVIDASGRRALLSRRLGLYQRTEEHPIAAAWSRWSGVKDLDGVEILGRDPRHNTLPDLPASRRLATNHFCGYGWWIWVIPVAGARTSIGVVYNKELFELPGEGTREERFRHFLTTLPGLCELLADAEMEEDFSTLAHLPYRSSQYMGLGWALVGDAAGFIDPYYSPGLDHASISVFATARRLEEDLSGTCSQAELEAAVGRHNETFVVSYQRWLSALYLGKYEILGDAELTIIAFLVDTALYYMGVVTPVYRNVEALQNPIFAPPLPQSKIAYKVMETFNRRLVHLARMRRRVGTYGRRNHQWRLYTKAFGLGAASLRPLLLGLRLWLRIEVEGLAARLRRGRIDTSQPVPTPVPAPVPAAVPAPIP